MAYWDYLLGQIIHRPDAPWDGYPGWLSIDCGCSAGLEWGGDSPRECRTCGGNGIIARHVASGLLALYPGGPAVGREPRK